MIPYDRYHEYHTPYTEQEEQTIEEAKRRKEELEENILSDPARYMKRDGKYYDLDVPEGQPVRVWLDPVVEAHMNIALARANEQLEGIPYMPDGEESALRFPGIDPVGKGSIVEMQYAERIAQVKAAAQLRPPELRDYVNRLVSMETDESIQHNKPRLDAMCVWAIYENNRLLPRASKLCQDREGSRILYEQLCALKLNRDVLEYERYVEGLEYAVGLKSGPIPDDIKAYYEAANIPLDEKLIAKNRELDRSMTKLDVSFQNFDNSILHYAVTQPENWGRKPEELLEAGIDFAAEIESRIPPYARTTADRVLTPLFAAAEENETGDLPISRGDYIIVDGMTVRERMMEEYREQNGENMDNFDAYYAENVRQKANEYVSAALMADKRVEAFVPDKAGRIADEPMQITKSGYEPSPLRKVTLNAWERFFAKRGFFKEKAAKAAEYERAEAARNRVHQRAMNNALEMGAKSRFLREQFFGEWSRETGRRRPVFSDPEKMKNFSYTFNRNMDTNFAALYMVSQGYKIDDIFDPTKLLKEKQTLGRLTMERIEACDISWIHGTLYQGFINMADQIDEFVHDNNLHIEDERELFRTKNAPMFVATQAAFDATQQLLSRPQGVEHYHDSPAFHAFRNAGAGLLKDELLGLDEAQQIEVKTNAAEKVLDRVMGTAQYFSYATKSLKGRINLIEEKDTMSLLGSTLGSVMAFEDSRRCYGQALWGDKSRAPATSLAPTKQGETFTTCFKQDDMNLRTMMTANLTVEEDSMRALADDITENPAKMRELGTDLSNGTAQKRMVFNASNDVLRKVLQTSQRVQNAVRINPKEAPALENQQPQRNAPAPNARVR